MILWTIKQLNSVRLAIAGRQQPSHLAWGLAFGVLLGIVPHGNLLAILLLLVVLSMNLNHAMAALTAVGVTFLARRLDPYSDWVGHHLLTHPEGRRIATAAWQYPLVPWTDLNNTVVLGSLAIGLLALFPLFLISYPLFRRLGPRVSVASPDTAVAALAEAPRAARPADDRTPVVTASIAPQEAVLIPTDPPESDLTESEGTESEGGESRGGEGVSAEESGLGSIDSPDSAGGTLPARAGHQRAVCGDGQPEFDESLRFLLHQLRDSKSRDAA